MRKPFYLLCCSASGTLPIYIVYRCMCRELNDSDGLYVCMYILSFLYIYKCTVDIPILWHINADDDDTTHTIIQFKMVAWENPLILNTDHSSLRVCIVLVLCADMVITLNYLYIVVVWKHQTHIRQIRVHHKQNSLLLVGDSISKLYLLWFKRNYILQPDDAMSFGSVCFIHTYYNPL